MIQISGVSHTYSATRTTPAQVALKEVGLTIEAGEMVVFLGPNGSGKSTLLRILMTVQRPSAGTVWIDGLELGKDAHAVRRLLGVVFQKPALDAKMTVRENLRASGLLYDLPRRHLDERIAALLEQIGLSDRADARVGSLSGGMARRVELAKALLPNPKVLILDEPTTGLDPVARQDFWRQIAALRAQTHLTVVATTHLLDEAQRCDRVAILHRGQLLAFDRPGALQSRIGRHVLAIQGEDLPGLCREVGAFLQLAGRIVDRSLLVTLSRPISIDALLERFQDRIQSLTIAHPSLDDVFIHYTGEHLKPEEGNAQ